MPSSTIAFIGAGRLAHTLARAWSQRGEAVVAVASRNLDSAARLAALLPGCAVLTPQEAVDQAELVFITVPDDSIGLVAGSLRWRAGQQVVHCSGATEVAALQSAAAAGAAIGGFHPLQIFSDPELALQLLGGSSVAIESDGALDQRLRALAARLDLHVITLPPGSRSLYHGGASFAASFLLSLLHEAVQAWAAFGVNEADALQALLPMARGTLASAEHKGLAKAVSGPASRADLSVLQTQISAFSRLGPRHAGFYRDLALRQLPLIAAGGRLSDDRLAALHRLLAGD